MNQDQSNNPQAFDDLAAFASWWLNTRTFCPPRTTPISFYGNMTGVVLYRHENYQVELFIADPDSVAPSHVHPDVDSFELYLSGDLVFNIGGVVFDPALQDSLSFGPTRIRPDCWHDGKTGKIGGAFLSIQKWLNGVPPTSVGDNWADSDGNKRGVCVDRD
ncbi:MAG: hypothetical protein ACXWF8_05275 [Methylobacter sp.]